MTLHITMGAPSKFYEVSKYVITNTCYSSKIPQLQILNLPDNPIGSLAQFTNNLVLLLDDRVKGDGQFRTIHFEV